ncbi:MAG: FlgD immunoglobulin-like domain containing protein [Candidatus Krumholzibacteriia bacterium]
MADSEGSFWIPNPLEIADIAVTASAPWKDSILMAGPSDLYLLDVRDTLKPKIHSQALGSYTDLAVGGDLVAAVESSHVDIFRLPALDLLARITFSAGDLVVAIQDSLLGVADPRNLYLYSLSDPAHPTLLGSVGLGFEVRSDNWGRDICLGFPSAIATSSFGSTLVGYSGQMSVVDITHPTQPKVSDFHDSIPGWPDGFGYFNAVIPFPPGFLVSSVAIPVNPYLIIYENYVTRLTVGSEGKVEWDYSALVTSNEYFTFNTLFSDHNLVYFKSNFSPVFVADADWNTPTFRFSLASPDIGLPPLSWIPEKEILSCGNVVFRISDFGRTPVEVFHGGSDVVAKLDGSTAVELISGSSPDWSFWSLKTVDLSITPPHRISIIEEEYRTANEMALVGRRAYISDRHLQADIAADGTIAPAEATTFPPITAVLAWDQYQVVSHDKNILGIYTIDQNNDPILVASLPNLPPGQLMRIGDYLYLGGNGRVSVIDLTDPLAPILLGSGPLAGRFGSISGDRLLTFDDSILYLHDVSDPLSPTTKGSQDIGASIRDVLFLKERIYLALGTSGISVMKFVPGMGARCIGGDLFTQASRLIHTDWGILTDTKNAGEELHLLPLERLDPLPVGRTSGGAPASPAPTKASESDAGADLSAHPNPANPMTLIRYFVPQEGLAKLAVFSLDGRRVATLVDGYQQAGPGSAQWDGTDHGGRPVPSGVYLLRLETEKAVSNGRVTLIR